MELHQVQEEEPFAQICAQTFQEKQKCVFLLLSFVKTVVMELHQAQEEEPGVQIIVQEKIHLTKDQAKKAKLTIFKQGFAKVATSFYQQVQTSAIVNKINSYLLSTTH